MSKPTLISVAVLALAGSLASAAPAADFHHRIVRKNKTFSVDRKMTRNAFVTRTFQVNAPGHVFVNWLPRTHDGNVTLRVRQVGCRYYVAYRCSRAQSSLQFRVTPRMIAAGNRFVIEVVSDSRGLRKVHGKIRVNKPAPR